jgi:hypothetical protein
MGAGVGMLFLCTEQAGQTLPAPVKVLPQDVQTAISYLRRGEPQLYPAVLAACASLLTLQIS